MLMASSAERVADFMNRRNVPHVRPYNGAAGGWDALAAVASALRGQEVVVNGVKTLLRNNQPEGFDCPGCAWPDPKHTSQFEFCENGAKAVTWEATSKRTTPEFFAAHSVTELLTWSDYALENEGRLTHPMVYDAATDRFVPVAWEDAFSRIGAALTALPDPDMAEFYTSGRASNEAAFLYQVMVRAYGTNNFPDCSNMCHEATSVGLPVSIGVGKGTVTLEDYDKNDLLLSFGHNPGTNHPRMMTTLRNTARRGVPIIVFNPLKERALERFMAPQDPVEMATMTSTPIASAIHQVRVGGDVAVLKGMMKRVLERDEQDLAAGGPGKLDRLFITEHTSGFDALRADLAATSWTDIERVSGLTRAAIQSAGDAYVAAERVIIAYGMGMTQHRSGTANVQQMMNLLLLRGNVGRPGAGIAPIRGHSNVQGDRTVGITEIPNKSLLDGVERAFGFRPPARVRAQCRGGCQGHHGRESQGHRLPGRQFRRRHVRPARDPGQHAPDGSCRASRHEAQSHASHDGRAELHPASPGPHRARLAGIRPAIRDRRGFGLDGACLSRPSNARFGAPALGAGGDRRHRQGDAGAAARHRLGLAHRRLRPHSRQDRDRVSGLQGLQRPHPAAGGFMLDVAASRREWRTPNKKANFLLMDGLCEDPRVVDSDVLTLTTLRAHDQYNTTIYGLNDRYRGIFGRRDVLFMNESDLAIRDLAHGDAVELELVPLPAKHRLKTLG